MTSYRTCFNCAVDRKTCATRAALRKSLAGLGVLSVAFNCAERKPKFMPGDRVSVTWSVIPEDWHYEDGVSRENWPATVSGESGGKFVIRVDDVDSDCGTPARSYVNNQNLYCKVSATKLEKLDEPAREVCKRCGEIGGEGFKGCMAIDGDGKFPTWREPPEDCARAVLSKQGARP